MPFLTIHESAGICSHPSNDFPSNRGFMLAGRGAVGGGIDASTARGGAGAAGFSSAAKVMEGIMSSERMRKRRIAIRMGLLGIDECHYVNAIKDIPQTP